jgi:hypothetical protein
MAEAGFTLRVTESESMFLTMIPYSADNKQFKKKVINLVVDQGLENIFCKEPDGKYFKFFRPNDLCLSHPTLPS